MVIRKGPSTTIESLDALLTANLELQREVADLKQALAELESKLAQYWDLQEGVDYRSLVDRIREEARSVGDLLKSLDYGSRKKLALLGAGGDVSADQPPTSRTRLLPSVHALLRTLDEWK